jgi:TetR/AcrR family transcriptional repressor of lmrAB and yxaGH operons
MTERKGQRTRATIVASAARLLRGQGYGSTGLNQIADVAGAPKGSLYFHFPGGKDELVASALAHAADQWREQLLASIRDEHDLGRALARIGDLLARELEASGYAHGCPLATVTLEAAASNPVLQAVVANRYAALEQIIGDRIIAAGVPADHAAQLALLVLSAIEGALLLARAHRDATIVRRITRQLAALVPQPSPPKPRTAGVAAPAVARARRSPRRSRRSPG